MAHQLVPGSIYLAPDGRQLHLSPEGQWVTTDPPPFPSTIGPNDPTPNTSAYTMGLPVAGPSTHAATPPIDPSLLPLPPQNTTELSQLRRASPVPKVAGSRRPVRRDPKGKGKAYSPPEDSYTAVHTSLGKRGRTKGAANYRDEEITHLLDLVEAELPVGSNGWADVGKKMRLWAVSHGFPKRSDKSLESKYKQLVKTSKPTGDAECPPAIERAHVIEDAINEKVGTRDLDDADIDDRVDDDFATDGSDAGAVVDDNEEEDDEDDPQDARPPKKAKVQETSVRAAPAPTRRTRTKPTTGLDLLHRISSNFDPTVQAQQASDRAASSFQNVQLLGLMQELRDLRTEVTTLRSQLSDAQQRQRDAEQRADRVAQETRLARMLEEATTSIHHGTPRHGPLRYHPSPNAHFRHHKRSYSHSPGDRRTPRRRYEVTYHDGTHRSYWGYPEEAPVITSPPSFYRETTDTPSRGPDHFHGLSSSRSSSQSPQPGPSHAVLSPSTTPAPASPYTMRLSADALGSSAEVQPRSRLLPANWDIGQPRAAISALSLRGRSACTPTEWSPSPTH